MINLIDLVILVAAVIGLANGYRRGFWLSLAQYVGLVVGVVLGAASAPLGVFERVASSSKVSIANFSGMPWGICSVHSVRKSPLFLLRSM